MCVNAQDIFQLLRHVLEYGLTTRRVTSSATGQRLKLKWQKHPACLLPVSGSMLATAAMPAQSFRLGMPASVLLLVPHLRLCFFVLPVQFVTPPTEDGNTGVDFLLSCRQSQLGGTAPATADASW
jgi:hypothetical protein